MQLQNSTEVMTPEVQTPDVSCMAPALYYDKDVRQLAYSFLHRIHSLIGRLRHAVRLFQLSAREIRREFCKFARRTRTLLTTKRHHYTGSFGPDLGPAAGTESNGHPVSCTRTLGRIQDIQTFFRSNPGATATDTETLLVGWDMGAEWAASHGHSCTPGSCKRYMVSAHPEC